MAFLAAFILLLAFTANVAFGAVNGNPILGSVAEMLLLLGASCAFVVGILKREAQSKRDHRSE